MTTHEAAPESTSRHRAPATLHADEAVAVDAALAEHAGLAGALLPVLHAIQDRIGYVPAASLPRLAASLNCSVAEIHGVLTFYHHFRTAPGGRHVLRICRAEACQAVGSEALAQHAQRTLGIAMPGTGPDGRFTLEPVYCLGNCACGPSLSIDDSLHAHVTAERFDELVADCGP